MPIHQFNGQHEHGLVVQHTAICQFWIVGKPNMKLKLKIFHVGLHTHQVKHGLVLKHQSCHAKYMHIDTETDFHWVSLITMI